MKAAVTSLPVASGWLASSSATTKTAGLEVIVKTDRVTPGVDFDTVAVLVEQGGQWGNAGPACRGQACNALTGTCKGECTPTTPQRVVGSQNALRICGADGTWASGSVIPCVNSTCYQGKCQGCLVSATRSYPGGANEVLLSLGNP